VSGRRRSHCGTNILWCATNVVQTEAFVASQSIPRIAEQNLGNVQKPWLAVRGAAVHCPLHEIPVVDAVECSNAMCSDGVCCRFRARPSQSTGRHAHTKPFPSLCLPRSTLSTRLAAFARFDSPVIAIRQAEASVVRILGPGIRGWRLLPHHEQIYRKYLCPCGFTHAIPLGRLAFTNVPSPPFACRYRIA
jgi:hypothetical protein